MHVADVLFSKIFVSVCCCLSLLSVLPRCYSEFVFKHYVELRQIGIAYGVSYLYCVKVGVGKQVLRI